MVHDSRDSAASAMMGEGAMARGAGRRQGRLDGWQWHWADK